MYMGRLLFQEVRMSCIITCLKIKKKGEFHTYHNSTDSRRTHGGTYARGEHGSCSAMVERHEETQTETLFFWYVCAFGVSGFLNTHNCSRGTWSSHRTTVSCSRPRIISCRLYGSQTCVL